MTWLDWCICRLVFERCVVLIFAGLSAIKTFLWFSSVHHVNCGIIQESVGPGILWGQTSLKMRAVCYLKMLGSSYALMQCHTPGQNPHFLVAKTWELTYVLFTVGDIRINVIWEEIGLGHVQMLFWCGIEDFEESNNVLPLVTSLVAETSVTAFWRVWFVT
jgi:hypothetical protein